MYKQFLSELETSRHKLLNVVRTNQDVTFIRLFGNIGDDLIYAGIRQLLRDIPYREISVRNIANESGSLAIIAGGGSWCSAFHLLPSYLKAIEQRFQSVVVYPSSFDISVDSVRESLQHTKAIVFARELESYQRIRDLCHTELAHDCAFFFDFSPFQRQGHGVLNTFRTDPEAVPFTLPVNNNDISVTCETLDEWLWTIARYDTIQTDRTHVTIAAAMLGKQVKYRPSNYHKLPGIVQFALSEFPVVGLESGLGSTSAVAPIPLPVSDEVSRAESWSSDSQDVGRKLAKLVPAGSSVILVDDGKLELDLAELISRHIIPFTERAGVYFGPPQDDATAVKEMKRLLEIRPTIVAFAWPAFWWLQSYPELRKYLELTFPCVHRDELLIAFDLRCRGL
jgi:hypothetical protein